VKRGFPFNSTYNRVADNMQVDPKGGLGGTYIPKLSDPDFKKEGEEKKL
jgi:hypothetical protein